MANAVEYSKHMFKKLLGDFLTDEDLENVFLYKDYEGFGEDFKDFNNLKFLENGVFLNNIIWFCFSIKSNKKDVFDDESRVFVGFINCNFASTDMVSLEQAQISEFEIHAGVFLRIVKDVDIKLNENIPATQIEQNLAFQHKDSFYKGHEFEEVKNYFEDMKVFEVGKDSVVRTSKPKVRAQYIISNSSSCVRLPLGEVGDGMRELFAESSPLLFDNVFSALTSTYWEHAFLELYRAVEAIYQIPKVTSLKESLGDRVKDLSVIDLARACYEKLGWRPFEKESLKSLLRVISEQELEKLVDFGIINQPEDFGTEDDRRNKIIEKGAEAIYQTRNKLVHRIYYYRESIATDAEWQNLLRFLVIFVSSIYSHYSRFLK